MSASSHDTQPPDQTFFKPIKTYQHQEESNLMQNDPNSAFTIISTAILWPHNGWKAPHLGTRSKIQSE